MITEQQQEQASLYALGAMGDAESHAFEVELRGNAELSSLVRELQRTTDLVAMSTPATPLPPALKDKVLRQIDATRTATVPLLGGDRGGSIREQSVSKPALSVLAGLRFLTSDDQKGWKQLPVPGAYIKLLSLEKERGYAVLMGKLDPGVRYPAHTNVGPEDFYILTGDLVIGDRKLVAGDFHHADGGSHHAENYSEEGCTLIAVLTTDDPLVAFAMA